MPPTHKELTPDQPNPKDLKLHHDEIKLLMPDIKGHIRDKIQGD